MRARFTFLVALPLSLPQLASSATYTLTKRWAGNNFLSSDWVWYTGYDPSNGRVNYVTRTVAEQEGLVQTSGDVLFLRSDHFRTLSPVLGRDSIRISSQESWDDAIFVLDLKHMPTGCATSPAFWTRSATGPWPAGGEIDIIEGVNLNTYNQATLHTTSGCKMPPDSQRSQTGITLNTSCDAAGNVGCGIGFTDPASFGSGFNSGNGGLYVMSKSQSTGIQIWFWPSNSVAIPPELYFGSTLTPNSLWGTPAANFTFVPGFCDYSRHFNAHQIVIDLTFCGDWAGNVWAKSNCATQDSSCTDYVNNNPEEFVDAFWAINSLQVFT